MKRTMILVWKKLLEVKKKNRGACSKKVEEKKEIVWVQSQKQRLKTPYQI